MTLSNNNSDNSSLGSMGSNSQPVFVFLTDEQAAGHGDHWSILTDDISNDVPTWLQQSIDTAAIPAGLNHQNTCPDTQAQTHLLLSDNQMCHINQVLAMQDGKPKHFVNAYPCVNSPYGLCCKIERIIANEQNQDAVLCLLSEDGSRIYAFDQLYTINHTHYDKHAVYFVNFSAWAYEISLSKQDEIVKVEDPEAIRYHRAFNDILAANNGIAPADIEEQIAAWHPSELSDDDIANGKEIELAPVEINFGHMCAYLFGETLGQEDEAWCQGQVLGKQDTQFYGQSITVLDVAILREPDADPFVVRIATPDSKVTDTIAVNDYIQANIWLQAAIYQENQNHTNK